MTLRSRIFLHYGLLLAGLILVGLYTEHQLDSVNETRRALREEWEELDQTLALSTLVHGALREAQAGNRAQALEGVADLRGAIAGLRDYQGEQRSELAEPYAGEEVGVLSRLSEQVSHLERALHTQGSDLDFLSLEREIETTLSEFHRIAETEMAEAIQGIYDTERLLDALMWIWLAALLLAAGFGAMTLRSRVILPLRALRDGAAAIHRREFEHRIDLRHRDEIREVAEAFNEMSAELGGLLASLEEKVETQAREIERSARLATIGTLAAGVAHEINNPLEAIGVRAEGMRRRADDDDLRSGLSMIAEEVQRCREITTRLLDFARQRRRDEPTPAETVDLRDALRGAHELLSLRGRDLADVDLDLPPMPLEIEGHRTALRQVFVNLMMNANDATSHGGRIAVHARAEGSQAVVEIKDTGAGIAAEDLSHVFDPFHTTKGTEGTGLGLSVSHGIVLDHGGTIEIRSEGSGKGTLARVTFPLRRAKR
jgi:signal transduction histidine kinase